MGRGHANLKTSIWGDSDFTALSSGAQWLYFLVLSQPGLTLCGVVSLTVVRWAALASDGTPAKIRRWLTELVASHFVVIDEKTEEVWVRTFTKHDGVLKQPNVVVAMSKAFVTIQSEAIRHAFIEGLPEGFLLTLPSGYPERLAEDFLRLLLEGEVKGFGNPSTNGSGIPSRAPARADPRPQTPRPYPDASEDQNPSTTTSDLQPPRRRAVVADPQVTGGWA